MKKEGFLASLIFGGTLSSVFNFLKSQFVMCDVFERKVIRSLIFKNVIYKHDSAVRNSQVYQ